MNYVFVRFYLEKGFEVFRSVSPASSCDLVIVKNRKLYRVEVTMGYRLKEGELNHDKHNTENYDILCRVMPNEIVFMPDLNSL